MAHCKFLGVHIDENLNWDYHMEHLHNEITTNLHLLRSTKNILNTDSLRKQQKQCLRILGKLKSRESTDPTFRYMKILKFPDMIQLEMYKLGQQLKFKQLPDPIIREFNAYGGMEMHRYPTRNKNLPNIQRHQGTIFNKSFLCRGIACYMLLPVEIQSI